MWYYKFENEERGPISVEDISTLISEGKLRAKSEVFCQGMADWKPVEDTVLSCHLPPPEERDDIRFWRLQAPEYKSDYMATFINGSIDHPYGLPGVECSICGDTWAWFRVLANQCPAELQKNLSDHKPVSESDFKALVKKLQAASPELANVEILPGYDLQPVNMQIPSKPEADFFWEIGPPVVSDRIRQLLLPLVSPNDIEFSPVTFTKVGKKNAKLPPPIPISGEPEDIIDEDIGGGEAGKYFEMIVKTESGLPHGVVKKGECQGCGRVNIDSESRKLLVYEDMWPGIPIFLLATTLYVVVTDDIRKALIAARATNVDFKPISG